MGCKVGDSSERIDGSAKAVGQATYTADLSFSGILYGKFLGSPHAHAKIRSVNLEKAKRLPSVKAAIKGRDFPYLHGESMVNIPFLAIDRVRYVGEPVVAIAAENLAAAQEALDSVEVEYEELPAVFDPEEALKPDAPLIHEKLGTYRTNSFSIRCPVRTFASIRSLSWAI